MGFFDFMQKMAQGKPIFEDAKTEKVMSKAGGTDPVAPGESPSSAIRKFDTSSFPIVRVTRTTSHLQGANMQVYCHIENTWPEEIMLDKIMLLGMTHELDHSLHGGEEREFLVFSGPRPLKQYSEALLHYKTQQEGDYFEAIHDITYAYHAEDKTYSVSDIRLHPPIHDIYG